MSHHNNVCDVALDHEYAYNSITNKQTQLALHRPGM